MLQQYNYIKFLSEVCEQDLPDSSSIASIIDLCEKKLSDNLEYQVKSLEVEMDKDDLDYYQKCINYMDLYPDSIICKKIKAEAFCAMGNLVQGSGSSAHSNKLALKYYINAINANKEIPDVYKKLGKLFSWEGNYEKAVSCFTIIKRSDKVKKCYKEILKAKKGDEKVEALIKKGNYLFSIGNKAGALSCYSDAFGMAKSEEKKAEAQSKHIEMVNGSPEITSYLNDLTSNYTDYNFHMVNEEFITSLIGEII